MAQNSAEFKHQSVRDLAWSVCSPPLISQPSHACAWPGGRWYQKIYQETLSWLRAVDSDPAELDELLARQKDRRLGKYFETLWYYWLSRNPRYDIIENNLQLIIDGETLGEMDFILFDKKTRLTLHWEVAVKFYLGVADTSIMSNWHGPNLCDRLDIKVEYLLQRQSIISKRPRVVQWLKQRGIYIDECAVILKGRLYYPWCSHALLDVVSPIQSSSDHLRSCWLNPEQFEQAFDGKQQFMPLINTGWLERIPTLSVNERYFKKDIFEMLSNEVVRLPLHLKLCNPPHTRDSLFLVGMDWPQKKP